MAKLSGGERQRIALGRTILACPQLILLDEPLAGLDGMLKYQIIPNLQRVFAEFSIPMLFISHSLQEMRMMTDEVLVMNQGLIEKDMQPKSWPGQVSAAGGAVIPICSTLNLRRILASCSVIAGEKLP